MENNTSNQVSRKRVFYWTGEHPQTRRLVTRRYEVVTTDEGYICWFSVNGNGNQIGQVFDTFTDCQAFTAEAARFGL